MSIEPTWIWTLGSGVAVALMVLMVCVVWLSRRLARLERQHTALMTGVEGGNLESLLEQHLTSLHAAQATLSGQGAQIAALTARTETAYRHIGLVRYNPFADGGGDFSFALALTDDRGDGVVLCSLFARSGARIYCKPLAAWETTYALTDEEQEAIAAARQKAQAQW